MQTQKVWNPADVSNPPAVVTKVERSGTIMDACSTEVQELLLLLLVFKASKAPKSAVPAGKH